MHTVTQYAPLAGWLILIWGIDRWSRRPAARARWARLSLRARIARQVRTTRILSALQAGYLVLFAGLRMTDHLSFSGWLAGTITAVFYLALDLYLLHLALAARRAHDGLNPFIRPGEPAPWYAAAPDRSEAAANPSGQPEPSPLEDTP